MKGMFLNAANHEKMRTLTHLGMLIAAAEWSSLKTVKQRPQGTTCLASLPRDENIPGRTLIGYRNPQRRPIVYLILRFTLVTNRLDHGHPT
jgi:hypothetical protein